MDFELYFILPITVTLNWIKLKELQKSSLWESWSDLNFRRLTLVVMWRREEGGEIRERRCHVRLYTLIRQEMAPWSKAVWIGMDLINNRRQNLQKLITEWEGWRRRCHGKQRLLTSVDCVFIPWNRECRKRSRFVPEGDKSCFGCFEAEDFHYKVKWQKLTYLQTNPEYENNWMYLISECLLNDWMDV